MKDVYSLLDDAKNLLDDIDIPYGKILSVNVNTRAERRWGRCTRKRDGYVIEISNRLLGDDIDYSATMNTMVHELLHAYNGRVKHTGDWKTCATKVNQMYPFLNIKRCSSAAEYGVVERPDRYKFIVTCNRCDRKYKYMRRSAVIQSLERDSHSCRCTCGCSDLRLEVM